MSLAYDNVNQSTMREITSSVENHVPITITSRYFAFVNLYPATVCNQHSTA